MQYEFITNLKEIDYNKIIEKCKYIHYRSDNARGNLQTQDNIYHLALKKKRTFLGCAKAEIIGIGNCKLLNVSNISLLKKDTIITSLFINEIRRFAKEIKAYKIKISSYDEFSKLKVKNIKQHSILNLYNDNKFFRRDYFKKIFKYDKNNLLTFTTKVNIEELQKVINIWNIKLDFDLKNLIESHKNNCSIICEKIDLVYYLSKVESSHCSSLDITTIRELIDEYGDEMIVGFSITLFPTNKNTAYCISLKNIEAFEELHLKNSLIIEIINICLKKKYKQILFADHTITNQKINSYEYEITLNKFKNMILKLKKKED